jgi:hypothetical protein
MQNHSDSGSNSFSLRHLSDAALLSGIAQLTRAQSELMARLVAHLAEMDARKLYLGQAVSSLFAYCRERLGFSEDEAYRRVEAARLARRFPSIFALLENGSISLSVLAKLKPFLSEANATELLDSVSGKSVREAERILAAKFPKPDVPDSIRKLPEKTVASSAPTTPAPAASAQSRAPAPAPVPTPDRGRLSPLSAERVLVKFTASRALEEKLELARDLMRHSNPSGDLATVIEAALDLLIAARLKQKFGCTDRPAKARKAKPDRITNATRRAVLERDRLQCTFVDAAGNRCKSRGFLELDHRTPKAKRGGGGPGNARTLCRAHNQAEAERVFGKAHIERCRKRKPLEVRDGRRPHYEYGLHQPATKRVNGFGWPDGDHSLALHQPATKRVNGFGWPDGDHSLVQQHLLALHQPATKRVDVFGWPTRFVMTLGSPRRGTRDGEQDLSLAQPLARATSTRDETGERLRLAGR